MGVVVVHHAQSMLDQEKRNKNIYDCKKKDHMQVAMIIQLF